MIVAKSKAVPAKTVRELLDRYGQTLDQALSDQVSGTVYAFSDGRALLVMENGRGRLYESRDAFAAMMVEVQELARQPPVNPFRKLLPQGRNFTTQVPELVRQLAQRLSLPEADLTGSQASLNAVEIRLRKLGPKQALTPEVFAPLTAYMGEVIRGAVGGRWEMRLGSDGEVWEPWIIDPAGRAYAPFAIFKDIHEYGRSTSPQGFVAGQIGSRLLS